MIVQVWFCPIKPNLHLPVSSDEAVRATMMEPASKATEFLAGRSWLRFFLAEYLPGHLPTEFEISIDAAGKPYAADFPGLHFNISHSGNCVALGFGARAVGVDIEQIRPVPDWQALAVGLLPGAKIDAILAMPGEQQDQAFLQSFTAHESYGKAMGTGLTGNLKPKEIGKTLSSSHRHLKAAPADLVVQTPHGLMRGSAIDCTPAGVPAAITGLPGYVGHVCLADTPG